MPKVLITTIPFGERDRRPLNLLEAAGAEYVINPLKRRLSESDLVHLIQDFDVMIAGTEQISDRVLAGASRLRLISRVGVGLDSVDLLAARRRGIRVSYTPHAPAPAVAELAIGFMLALLRSVHVSNAQMHRGQWHRFFGRRLGEVTIGIVGLGRIGGMVLERLGGFCPKRILANDIAPNPALNPPFPLEWVSKEILYQESDIVTLHLPMTAQTRNLLRREHLYSMKPDALIINTSRGGIVNEDDLYEVLLSGYLGGAAIDVFENEPYKGRLAEIERCLLTSHMGSMSVDCRARMELEATEEAVRFLNGEPLVREVPQSEYDIQGQVV